MSHWVRVEPAPPRMRFSPFEIQHILLAMGAMTLAFLMAFFGGITGLLGQLESGGPTVIAFAALASFVAVVTAFLLHELAHKAVAQRYGCFAEFRAYPMGLVLGILTAAFGFMFAAPGAVMVSGSVSPRQHLRISAAGPATNLGIATAFIALATGLQVQRSDLADLATLFVSLIAFVNLFLGGFNLIPFPPLDGSKVFALSKPVWVAMVAALITIGYVGVRLGVIWI